MLVKPGVLLAAGMGVGMSRPQLSSMGIQIIRPVAWSKKALVLRNQPFTAVHPTVGQMDVRIKFGETAHSLKGTTGKINGIPAVAYKMGEAMRGFHASKIMSKEEYTRGTAHTVEQLRAMRAKMKA